MRLQVLTDVFVGHLMGKTNSLRLMLNRLSIYNGMLKLVHDRLVDGIALTRHGQHTMCTS